MHSQFVDHQFIEIPEAASEPGSSIMEPDKELENIVPETITQIEPTRFSAHFEDCMEMYADAQTVAKYLDSHHGWFRRCAHPMKVEPLGENGYALLIGCFGAFGYEVEPRIGLELLPQDQGIYRIKTIPVPGYVPPGYEVDYKAAMELVEVPADSLVCEPNSVALFQKQVSAVTRVEWQLDLAVYIRFPKFIHKLPRSVIQNTGDSLLCKIVRQVSRRLTYKVQEDFHTTLGLPIPRKTKKCSVASRQ